MREDSEAAASSSSPRGDSAENDSDHSKPPPFSSSSRNASSRYDFVKVKVWLGDLADHYYVLSRFLLSRMLTVTKIPNHIAVKIALELKKLLIDNSLLDVSQSDLEANLFKLMEPRGYGDEYINRYKLMTRFHHQRVPLIILVCGTACVGKSTIATQIAQRLNLPNVLQTDMVYELLRTSTDAPLASTPVWAREFSSSEELITEFCRECRIVRKGLAGDLKKAMKDGKPIIIEGIHLDPSIYLMDEESKSSADLPEKPDELNPVSIEDMVTDRQMGTNPSKVSGNSSEESICTLSNMSLEEEKSSELSDAQEPVNVEGSVLDNKGETVMDTERERNVPAKKEKSGLEPIVIPIVLKMAEFDHKALLEEWIAARRCSDKYPVEETDRLTSNLKTIQNYLCSFESQGLTVVNISATTFPQTLDWLHGYLLQSIEQGVASATNENGQQPSGS